MDKVALIVGIAGQDGSLLAKYLLSKNYRVIGTTTSNRKQNLIKLGIYYKIKLINKKNYDENFFKRIFLDYNINELYNLSGQSSVAKSEKLINETIDSNIRPLVDILEVIRKNSYKIKIINAVSSEMFGNTYERISEKSKINPLSFYGLAKSIAYEIAKSYREQFQINISNLILFNHESNLRPNNFVIKKIVSESKKITKNKNLKIKIGNINISRDWGWAPEYVEVMYKIANSKFNEDFVVATGKNFKLIEIIKKIFSIQNLKIKNNLKISKSLFRRNEILKNRANINKIKRKLNWKSKFKIEKILLRLINEK